jgi:Skp family chaperone for outer membrane proteins
MSTGATSSTAVASPTLSDDSQRRTAEARDAVTATLSSVGSSYDAELQRRAADLHANSKAIEKQENELKKQTAALAKQTAQWEKLVDTSTKKLKEIGDVQNWAEVMERDLLVIEETLRLVEGRPEAESASGTNGWA